MVFIQDTPESTATTFLGQANDLLISLWRDYPRLVLGPSLKLYYLSQTAFWVQQIFVINIEERRKDHWQMFTHHIVTVSLLVFSYGYRQMRAGNAVLVLMDVVDLIFPVCLKQRQIHLTLLTQANSSPRCSSTWDASKPAMPLSPSSSLRGS
jgi:acyl-CoA-dependent ceramide synthase